MVPPTFLVESATVSEHDAFISMAIKVGTYSATIISCKPDILLRRCENCQNKGKGKKTKR